MVDWNGGLEWWNGMVESQIQQKMRFNGHKFSEKEKLTPVTFEVAG